MIASAEKKKSRAVAVVAVAPPGVVPQPEVGAVMAYGGNSDYMSALIEQRNAVLDHAVFTGIINADPLPITAGIDSSSGLQDPHP